MFSYLFFIIIKQIFDLMIGLMIGLINMFEISFNKLNIKYGLFLILSICILYYFENVEKNVLSQFIATELITTILLTIFIGIPTLSFANKSNDFDETLIESLDAKIDEISTLLYTYKTNLIVIDQSHKENTITLNVLTDEQKKINQKINNIKSKLLELSNNKFSINDLIENLSDATKDTNINRHDLIKIKKNLNEHFS